MKFVNLIIGQKRNLIKNLDSITNCQNRNLDNINFFIFWKDDCCTEEEKQILRKKYSNIYFHTVKRDKFETTIKKIIKKNKGYPIKLQNAIIANYLQFTLVKYAFNYACKKLKSENFKKFFWQRIRSDTYVNNKVIDNPKKKTLYLPGTVHGYGIIDFHALGTFEEFKVYSNTIDTLDSLYKANIFGPPEIALRMQLTKFQINSVLTDKMPSALLKNLDKLELKHFYTLRGQKYHTNEFSKNIIEGSYVFKDILLLRKFYYKIYNYIIKIKLKLNNE